MSMSTYVESPGLPEWGHSQRCPNLPAYHPNIFDWVELEYRRGDITAVVAVYENIPEYLQIELDQLISQTYREKLLTVPFMEASLLLLSSDVLPQFHSLSKSWSSFRRERRLEHEQHRAVEFVTNRKPDDLVVMVFRANHLIATMTLFPFARKQDIPSLSYLQIDPAFNQLPNVPAVEMGRLAKSTCNGYALENSEYRFADMIAMAAAFIAADRYLSDRRMLPDSDSFICGDTHGTLINSLKRFFPLTVIDSKINPDMLADDNDARGMSIYFLQRQILGSFESSDEIIAAIQKIAVSNPPLANRIERLLDNGLQKLGVASIRQFSPKRFRVHFFHFPYNHFETSSGIAKLERMTNWMSDRPDCSPRLLN
jgi:hypothetical protein